MTDDDDGLKLLKQAFDKVWFESRQLRDTEIEEAIKQLAYWTPHCDNCSNQKFVVKVDELLEKLNLSRV